MVIINKQKVDEKKQKSPKKGAWVYFFIVQYLLSSQEEGRLQRIKLNGFDYKQFFFSFLLLLLLKRYVKKEEPVP